MNLTHATARRIRRAKFNNLKSAGKVEHLTRTYLATPRLIRSWPFAHAPLLDPRKVALHGIPKATRLFREAEARKLRHD